MHTGQRDTWRVLLGICLVLALVAPATAAGGGVNVTIRPGFPDSIPADGTSTTGLIAAIDPSSECGKKLLVGVAGGAGVLSASVISSRGTVSAIAEPFDEMGENQVTLTADSKGPGVALVSVTVSLKFADGAPSVRCQGEYPVRLVGSDAEPQPPPPADQPPEKSEEPPPQPEVKPDASQPEAPVVQPPPPATQGRKMKRDLIRTILAAIQQGKGPQDLPNWNKLSDRQKSKVNQVFNLALIMYLSAKPVKK